MVKHYPTNCAASHAVSQTIHSTLCSMQGRDGDPAAAQWMRASRLDALIQSLMTAGTIDEDHCRCCRVIVGKVFRTRDSAAGTRRTWFATHAQRAFLRYPHSMPVFPEIEGHGSGCGWPVAHVARFFHQYNIHKFWCQTLTVPFHLCLSKFGIA